MRNQIHLLKSRRFLPLFLTQFFGAFNDNAFKNAFLIWITYDVAKSTGINPSIIVTLATGIFILPFFLLSATAGQVADKYERSSLTRKIKCAEILLMMLCAFFFHIQSVAGLLATLFLMGIQSTFFGPIKYSLLPEHLKDDELISGNGLIGGGTFLSILFGTIFGGLIIRTPHGPTILSIFLVGFALIGWISSLSIPKAPQGNPSLKIGWNIARETGKIITYAKKEETVWLSIIGISWFWLIGATFLTQFPFYTKDIIGGNEHIVTLFLSIFSIGIGLGSLLCNKLLKGKIDGRLVPLGSIGITFAILVFIGGSFYYEAEHLEYLKTILAPSNTLLTIAEFLTVGPSSYVILLGLLILSVFAGIYIVPLYAIMQHHAESQYLSRIIAANNMVNALFIVIASLITIFLFSIHFDIKHILLTIGIINIPVFFIIRKVVPTKLNDA